MRSVARISHKVIKGTNLPITWSILQESKLHKSFKLAEVSPAVKINPKTTFGTIIIGKRGKYKQLYFYNQCLCSFVIHLFYFVYILSILILNKFLGIIWLNKYFDIILPSLYIFIYEMLYGFDCSMKALIGETAFYAIYGQFLL